MTDPRKLADEFVEGLKRDLGGRMRSAALFGSAARDEWIDGVSDVNVLVLVDRIDAKLLSSAAATARSSVRRSVMPLLMELEEWRRAGDVFTIELADMRDAHVPLFGDDPVEHYVAEPAGMRLQAERELRAKLLHLHAGMLLAGDDRKRLGHLFMHALPSFVTYMRSAIRLAGEPVASTTPAVIEHACRLAGADGDSFMRVFKARSTRSKLEMDLSDPFADHFNTAAQQLADYIDAHGGTSA
ncbi:MAG: nucleotidyltransferase domain-containing protein [Gemmatimonadetes bacterium]|nr:nucleotidyltransferase domain-containing protein [Gemmatimonadota bacterium]